jgi:hypothetical protein
MHLGPLRIVQVVLSVVLQPGLPSITWELTRNANSGPTQIYYSRSWGRDAAPKGVTIQVQI